MTKVYLEAKNITLDIPVFDVSRSFRQSLIKYYVGGKISNSTSVVTVRALENINFSLQSGDRLGLIGHNGSGKTSLLRVLAGVYRSFCGELKYHGKITPLFNPSIGVDADDTGLDNIFTIGMYLGMSKQEIDSKKEEIISFSGLGDFVHLPVRTYSCGMLLRLGFSIATSLEPQILLMDEGFGTGDTEFTEKAQMRLESFYKKLDILIMASHSDDLIRKLCNKVLLLERGKIKAYGNVDEVLNIYQSKLQETCSSC